MVLNGSHCYLYGINVTKHVKKWSKECNQTFVFQTTKTILNSSTSHDVHPPTSPQLPRTDKYTCARLKLPWKEICLLHFLRLCPIFVICSCALLFTFTLVRVMSCSVKCPVCYKVVFVLMCICCTNNQQNKSCRTLFFSCLKKCLYLLTRKVQIVFWCLKKVFWFNVASDPKSSYKKFFQKRKQIL